MLLYHIVFKQHTTLLRVGASKTVLLVTPTSVVTEFNEWFGGNYFLDCIRHLTLPRRKNLVGQRDQTSIKPIPTDLADKRCVRPWWRENVQISILREIYLHTVSAPVALLETPGFVTASTINIKFFFMFN